MGKMLWPGSGYPEAGVWSPGVTEESEAGGLLARATFPREGRRWGWAWGGGRGDAIDLQGLLYVPDNH